MLLHWLNKANFFFLQCLFYTFLSWISPTTSRKQWENSKVGSYSLVLAIAAACLCRAGRLSHHANLINRFSWSVAEQLAPWWVSCFDVFRIFRPHETWSAQRSSGKHSWYLNKLIKGTVIHFKKIRYTRVYKTSSPVFMDLPVEVACLIPAKATINSGGLKNFFSRKNAWYTY